MQNEVKQYYEKQGFVFFPSFFSQHELQKLTTLLESFHHAWSEKNIELLQRGVINSHSLTSSELLSCQEINELFRYISNEKILQVVRTIFGSTPKFLNTQLFFDPMKQGQANYWHRDIQYIGESLQRQQEMIHTHSVLHCRIALRNEYGIEIVKGTHKRWDSKFEEEIRYGKNGRNVFDEIPYAERIALQCGDVLFFSANTIHRGVYGGNRLSLDIIYCSDLPELRAIADMRNQPLPKEREYLTNNDIFWI